MRGNIKGMDVKKRILIRGLIIFASIFVFVIYVYKYNKEYNYGYEIYHNYKGIRYQSNNMDSDTPVNIIIDGIYKKKHGSKDYMFKGDIIIDGEPSHSSEQNEFVFNEYNMSSLENKNFRGMFYISGMMQEITIKIFEPNNRGGFSFNYDDGWLISAPSNTREEAVDLSKRLIRDSQDIISIR